MNFSEYQVAGFYCIRHSEVLHYLINHRQASEINSLCLVRLFVLCYCMCQTHLFSHFLSEYCKAMERFSGIQSFKTVQFKVAICTYLHIKVSSGYSSCGVLLTLLRKVLCGSNSSVSNLTK